MEEQIEREAIKGVERERCGEEEEVEDFQTKEKNQEKEKNNKE